MKPAVKVLLVIGLVLALVAPAAAGPYPSVKRANEVMADFLRGPCGESRWWSCESVVAAEMRCGQRFGPSSLICRGQFEESRPLGHRTCWLKWPSRVTKGPDGPVAVFADDTCYRGAWTP